MGGTLADELRGKIEEARLKGDARGLARAAAAGAAIGLDDPFAQAVRKSSDQKRAAKFAGAVKAARQALATARAMRSELSIERAVEELRRHLGVASKLDNKRRGKATLLELIGTSEEELDLLPIRFFTTVTIVPVDYEALCRAQSARDPDFNEKTPVSATATYELRRSREYSRGHRPTERSTAVGERQVVVVSISGAAPNGPIRTIEPGEPISGPPLPKIIYHSGEQFGPKPFLLMPDDRLAFTGEIGGEKIKLMGEGQFALMCRIPEWDRGWGYYPLNSDNKYDPHRPYLCTPEGSFTTVLPNEGRIVMEKYVQEPLFLFTHEVRAERYIYLAVLMKAGNVVVYEAPSSGDVDVSEGNLIEIACGFTPAREEGELAVLTTKADTAQPAIV
ncbi:hypothetical protein HZA85_02055 [Candidatus Uhrbacteria bacterium]|nr:hypothetical protein [Candidatus Uhrbacteria bacterium]